MARLVAVLGDITVQRVDAVANAASRAVRGGGGVDGAIHRAGGPAVLRDCVARLPDGLATGDAGWTTAGDLPATWVIHTVGPDQRAGERDPDQLASCYTRVLQVADELGVRTLAVPLVGAGVYGWPLQQAADVAVGALADGLATSAVREVRVVAHDERALAEVTAALEARQAR